MPIISTKPYFELFWTRKLHLYWRSYLTCSQWCWSFTPSSRPPRGTPIHCLDTLFILRFHCSVPRTSLLRRVHVFYLQVRCWVQCFRLLFESGLDIDLFKWVNILAFLALSVVWWANIPCRLNSQLMEDPRTDGQTPKSNRLCAYKSTFSSVMLSESLTIYWCSYKDRTFSVSCGPIRVPQLKIRMIEDLSRPLMRG